MIIPDTIKTMALTAANKLRDICYIENPPAKNIGQQRLIFPVKNQPVNGIIKRISEQEARFLFAAELESQNEYFYSIETPTGAKHSFSGTGGERSAQTDLSIYKLAKGFKKIVDVEFKHGTAKAKHGEEAHTFRKDIRKIYAEKTPAIWFNVLNSADKGTWRTLRKNFSFMESLVGDGKEEIPCYFVFCVIEREKDDRLVSDYEIADIHSKKGIADFLDWLSPLPQKAH